MAADTIHIRMARMAGPLPRDRFDALLHSMPDTVRRDLLAYKRWQDAQASLAGKLLLRQLLTELQLPGTLDDLYLELKERPAIHSGFDFNISHSGEYVLVALSTYSRVGIDVEKHRPLDPGLFRKYFSEAEWAQLDPADPLPAFFRLWSIKEAAIKCDGRGVEVLGKTHVLDAQTVRCDAAEWNYYDLIIAEGYSGAVCSDKPAGRIDILTADPFH